MRGTSDLGGWRSPLHPLILFSAGYAAMVAAAYLRGIYPTWEAGIFLFVGMSSSALGSWFSKRAVGFSASLLAASAATYLLLLLWPLAGLAAAASAASLLIVWRTSRQVKTFLRSRFESLVYVLGLALIFLNVAEGGASPCEPLRPGEPPLEAAAGSVLVILSFPWVLSEVLSRGWKLKGIVLTLATASISVTTGFRADSIVVLLEAALLYASRRRYDESATTLLAAVLVFISVGALRAAGGPAAAWNPLKRAATSMGYFYQLATMSWPFGIFEDPLFLLRQIHHPSQVIGRGLLGRGMGITPTAFGTNAVSFGIPEVAAVWFLIGMALELADSSRISGDPRPHALTSALLLVALDVGLTQATLFIVLASASMTREPSGKDLYRENPADPIG